MGFSTSISKGTKRWVERESGRQVEYLCISLVIHNCRECAFTCVCVRWEVVCSLFLVAPRFYILCRRRRPVYRKVIIISTLGFLVLIVVVVFSRLPLHSFICGHENRWNHHHRCLHTFISLLSLYTLFLLHLLFSSSYICFLLLRPSK